MLPLEVEEVIIVIDAETTITPTTTVLMVVTEYWSNPIFDTNFIVGPTVSTTLTTVVVAPTSSPVIRIPQSTPIKRVHGQRTHHVGVGLSLHEMVGGGARVI